MNSVVSELNINEIFIQGIGLNNKVTETYGQDYTTVVISEIKELINNSRNTVAFSSEAAGQLNMYLNYYATEVNDIDDNPPIGIILCTEKNNIDVEYALGGLSNQIFASKYVLYMPDKQQLICQVEKVLKKWRNKDIEKTMNLTEK